jgi:hypothetical protein
LAPEAEGCGGQSFLNDIDFDFYLTNSSASSAFGQGEGDLFPSRPEAPGKERDVVD